MKKLTRDLLRKTSRTLVLRGETLRALASVDLVQVGGGGAPGTGPVDSCPPENCTGGVA